MKNETLTTFILDSQTEDNNRKIDEILVKNRKIYSDTHGGKINWKDEIQLFWQHKLAPTKMVKSARINLTFRSIVTNQ